MNPRVHPIRLRHTHLLATLSALIACLAIVNAQDRAPASASREPRNPRGEQIERTQRALKILEQEAVQFQDRAQQMQSRIDRIKEELGVTDLEVSGGGLAPQTGETLRAMDKALVEARLEQYKMEGLLNYLQTLNRQTLRQALPTAAPDAMLSHLMQNLAETRQKQVAAETQLGKDHPDMKSISRLAETIEAQIEERLEGILAGLHARARGSQDTMERLRKSIDEERERLMAKAVAIGPIVSAQRELDTLRQIQDRIRLKLEQERLDSLLHE